MAFGKAIGAEAFDLPEAALGEIARDSRARPCPRPSFAWNSPIVPTRLKVAMARRSWSASAGVKPAATMAIFIACS